MDRNDMVLADWESKWLDPDYDMANLRYRDDEDEDDEDEFVDDEIDDALNYIFDKKDKEKRYA